MLVTDWRGVRFGPASVAMARVFKSQNQLDNGAAGDRYRYMAPLNLDTIHAGATLCTNSLCIWLLPVPFVLLLRLAVSCADR